MEILVGGLNAYNLFNDFSKANEFLVSFFNKYKIQIEANKRYYIELCLESNNATTVLWSLEYSEKKAKIIKTPESISTKEV